MSTPQPQHVIFKMDDLDSHWWKEWKKLTDLITSLDVKASLGIFFDSLYEGDKAYDDWVQTIAHDPRFELWSHGFSGHGPGGEPGLEYKGTPYDFQKKSFDNCRTAMLSCFDQVLRTYSEHWHGGDQTTVRVFNDDPYLRVWIWSTAGGRRQRGILPDRDPIPDLNVHMECADPADWRPGYVNFAEFAKEYEAHAHEPYLTLQGHPWSWTDTSNKPDRTGAVLDRWAEFAKIVKFLKGRGVRFTNPYEYYRIVRGFAADTSVPTAPEGLSIVRLAPDRTRLNWQAAKAGTSGVDCYKVYRDDVPIGLSIGTSFEDALVGSSPTPRYQIAAVSRNEVASPRSRPVILAMK
jgi:hypothetical protein